MVGVDFAPPFASCRLSCSLGSLSPARAAPRPPCNYRRAETGPDQVFQEPVGQQGRRRRSLAHHRQQGAIIDLTVKTVASHEKTSRPARDGVCGRARLNRGARADRLENPSLWPGLPDVLLHPDRRSPTDHSIARQASGDLRSCGRHGRGDRLLATAVIRKGALRRFPLRMSGIPQSPHPVRSFPR